MNIDIDWARGELANFLGLTDLRPTGTLMSTIRKANHGTDSQIVASAQVVEQILDRVLPR
ncbi:hypothetical protein ACIQIG_08325 [Streptomyces bacillaris]|nr:hypothetical protein [Streptomyces sp. CAI-24]